MPEEFQLQNGIFHVIREFNLEVQENREKFFDA
jgi:hypothetical protein